VGRVTTNQTEGFIFYWEEDAIGRHYDLFVPYD